MSNGASAVREAASLSTSSSSWAMHTLTDEVWQLVFQFLTAWEIVSTLPSVCRRFFRLTVGDIAAATRFWRGLWQTHLVSRGRSPASGGLGALFQSVTATPSLVHQLCASAATTASGVVPGAATTRPFRDGISYTEVNFVLDHTLASTRRSPFLFTVPPLHVSFRPAGGLLPARTDPHVSPSSSPPDPGVPHGGADSSRPWLRLLSEDGEAAVRPAPQSTATFLRLTARALAGGGRAVSRSPRGECEGLHTARDKDSEEARALLYAKALCFLHPRRGPRNVLAGPWHTTVRLHVFSEAYTRRDGMAAECFMRAEELCKALRHSWEVCYVHQLQAPSGAVDTASSSSASVDAPPPLHGADGTLRTGNALFDINVLTTRARKRTDVYQALVSGLLSPAPAGLGIFFPVTASPAALLEWARRERAAGQAADTRAHPRETAEAEERVIMADSGWATPRRYIMGPFFDEDDEKDEHEEGGDDGVDGAEDRATDGGTREGQAVAGPRRQRRLVERKMRRQAEEFRREEAELLLWGACYGSLCLNAHPGSLPYGTSHDAGGGSDSDSTLSTSVAMTSDSAEVPASPATADSHSFVDVTTGGQAGHRGAGVVPGGPVIVNPLRHLGPVHTSSALRRANDTARDGYSSSSSSSDEFSAAVASDGSIPLNGILAPGALDIRTPTDHNLPPTPHLSPAVPFLFPVHHVACYLYLLQHVTFSDVHHHVWEPDEFKCAVCARIVSPSGDAVETRFFSSHLLGSYPRVYMKMSFSPADLPAALILKKMEQPAGGSPSSASSTRQESSEEDTDSDTARPPAAASGSARARLRPVAFPLLALPRPVRPRQRHRSREDAAGDGGGGGGGGSFEIARARRAETYRHRDVLPFDAVVDLFCGGYGRVEVDIPPSVSRRGLEVLRTVLGLDEAFPISLLWNVVVYATGLGPQRWAEQLHQFLYYYNMTFTDAVERAFGLRACYGPLNGLRPREFADAPSSPRPSAQAAGPAGVPVSVPVREQLVAVDSTASDSHGSSRMSSPISPARSSDLAPSADTQSAERSPRNGAPRVAAVDGNQSHGRVRVDRHGSFSSLSFSSVEAAGLHMAEEEEEEVPSTGPVGGAPTAMPSPHTTLSRALLIASRLRGRRDSDSDSCEPERGAVSDDAAAGEDVDIYSDPSAHGGDAAEYS